MSAVAVFGTAMLIGTEGALALAGISVFESAQRFDLSVIPLFVLMGTFASKAGISSDLYSAFNQWLWRRKGGLAHASVAACASFGYGYSNRLATGSVAAGGTIGILIPPSVIMLIYGILTETSIGDLFIAGIIPGLLLTLLFMITIMIITRLDSSAAPQLTSPSTSLESTSVLSRVWPTLLLFLLVIGGIYSGFFTPTEASGFGAVGALVIGLLMRRLNLKLIAESLIDTVQTTSMIFLILIGAILFSNFLSLSGTPAVIGNWITELDLTPLATVIVIVLIYLVLGAFLDTMAMIILSIPIFFPIVTNMGFDPIWFGVLVVISVELALITPPMGINVFVIKGIAEDVSLLDVFIGVLPFCAALLVLIALVIAFPPLATYLPELAGK